MGMKEWAVKEYLEKIDILVLNHGIYKISTQNENYQKSIEINALSKLKFLNLFEEIVSATLPEVVKEVWVNT